MNCLSSLRIGPALVLGFCLGLAGCTPTPSGAPAPAPTPVTVSYPVEREVTDYADFTGRTAAVDSVEVRARVWGYLDKVNFKEGALVKKGDVLFEIDPRTYQAALDQAEGNLASMEARLKRLDADLARAQQLVGTGAMSREEYDKIAGDRGEAAASLEALQGGRGTGQAGPGVHEGHRAGQRPRQPVRGHRGQPGPVGRTRAAAPCSPPSCRWTRCTPTSTWTSAPCCASGS